MGLCRHRQVSHSTNGGDRWTLQPLTGVLPFELDLYAVHATEAPGEAFAVGAAGSVLHTIDQGRTWELQVRALDAKLA